MRRAALAIGLFALVVTGVHAGADRADDAAFEVLGWLDGLLDAVLARALPPLLGAVGQDPEAVERAVLSALEWVDLDEKLAASRAIALGLEVVVGLALALPLVDPTAPRASRVALSRALRHVLRDPTLLAWVAPLATGSASLAGLAVVAAELETLAAAGLAPLALTAASQALAARGAAIAVTLVVAVVLVVRGSLRALVRADALSAEDAAAGRSALRRRLRGWLVALVGLPLAWVAAASSLPALLALIAPWVGP